MAPAPATPLPLRRMRDSHPGIPSGEAGGADSCAVSALCETLIARGKMPVGERKEVQSWATRSADVATQVVGAARGDSGNLRALSKARARALRDPAACRARATRARRAGREASGAVGRHRRG